MIKEKNNSINFFHSIFYLFVVIVSVGALVFGLQKLNGNRKEKIIDKYVQEIQPYIDEHNDNIVKIFTETVPELSEKCQKNSSQHPSSPLPNKTVKDNFFDCITAKKSITELFPDTSSFDNYSATFFVAYGDSFYKNQAVSQVVTIKLSGEVNPTPSRNTKELEQLLKSEIDKPVIGVYSYDFSRYTANTKENKHVAIPIKNKDGKIVGAVVRIVIENY